MEGPDFKFHLSHLLFEISNANEQIEKYGVIEGKHHKRIKGYITLQKVSVSFVLNLQQFVI